MNLVEDKLSDLDYRGSEEFEIYPMRGILIVLFSQVIIVFL